MRRSQIILTTLGSILVSLGLVLGWQPLLQSLHQPVPLHVQAQAVRPTTPVAPALIKGQPVRIVLPSLGLDLPVINGYYNTVSQTWTLTKDKAQFAVNTTPPNNQEGNTFIYGHNRVGVFETLYKLKLNDQVLVYTDTSHVFTYDYIGATVTNPNDSSLFTYQGPPVLTLQTCSGLWYQNRQMFHFNLERVT
jgi:LPXTG-site transpeptidase (sortase) family protein